jgi:hypothetical protein
MDKGNSYPFDNVKVDENALYRKIWSKKHISSWFFLRNAVRSSLIQAVQQSSAWVKHYHRSRKKCKSQAEHSFIVGISYSKMLSGPLLSTIILSAASVEAFSRHCFVSSLRAKYHHIGQKEIDEAFLEFDTSPAANRMKFVASIAKAKEVSADLTTEIVELFGFRNSVMHSDPIYHSEECKSLIKLKVNKKNNRTEEKRPSKFKYYPDLTSNNMPLSLSHSLLSTTAHDKLVEHIIGTAEAADILEFLDEVDMTHVDRGLLWGDPTFSISYGQACLMAKDMNTLIKGVNNSR